MAMKERSSFVLIGVSILASIMGQGLLIASDLAEWRTYRNAKYGYEIRYSEEFEVWPTGPAGERDGRTIRVGLKEHAAPAPVLDIQMQAPAPTLESLADLELRDMDIIAGDAEINGVPAREITYRWKSSGDVALVELSFRDVLMVFHAHSAVGDVHKTVWWKVISTFRFLDE